jgi:hypothetical protein
MFGTVSKDKLLLFLAVVGSISSNSICFSNENKKTQETVSFENIIAKTIPGTVSVGLFHRADAANAEIFEIPLTGTGFFINDRGLLLTARQNIPHPLRPGDSVILFQELSKGKGFYAWSSNIILDLPELDLMAIQFAPKVASRVGWLQLSNDGPVPGEELGMVGYKASSLLLDKDGAYLSNSKIIRSPRVSKFIASGVDIRSISTEDGSRIADKRTIEMDADFETGFIGSPIISSKTGKVLGMVNQFGGDLQGTYQLRPKKGKAFTTKANVDVFTYGLAVDEILPSLPK